MKWFWIAAGVGFFIDFWIVKVRVRRLERILLGVDPRHGDMQQ